jgi:predicted nuclease of restriction endonuclease-like (RecB) superfamily
MDIKANINKIHIDLLNNFEKISIEEKNSLELGSHFEIIINESNKVVRAIISKRGLENEKINWKYYSNPNDLNSYLVERDSTVYNFYEIVKNIFEKNRFDSDYLKSLNN